MQRLDAETETLIPSQGGFFDGPTHSLRGEGFDASEDGTGRGTPLITAMAFAQNQRDEVRLMDVAGALAAEPGMKQQTYVAFAQNQVGEVREGAVVGTLNQNSNASGRNTPLIRQAIAWSEELTASVDIAGTIQYGGQGGRHDGVMTRAMQVRRLTPRECERLQGFPDDYSKISEKTADGPRYKALGNSMAVPCMAWLGQRIQMVEDAINGKE